MFELFAFASIPASFSKTIMFLLKKDHIMRKIAVASSLWPRLILGLSLCWQLEAVADATADAALERALTPVLASAARSEQNRARDLYRHPAQTLAFFKVRPDAALIELTPGGGWYAEILAPLLRERGSYTAAILAPEKAAEAQRAYMARARDSLLAKFKAAPDLYGAAHTVEFDPAAPMFGPPASADVVLTFRNVHNWAKAGNDAAYFRGFFAVLK